MNKHGLNRLLALILAFAMTLSLAAPAFATETEDESAQMAASSAEVQEEPEEVVEEEPEVVEEEPEDVPEEPAQETPAEDQSQEPADETPADESQEPADEGEAPAEEAEQTEEESAEEEELAEAEEAEEELLEETEANADAQPADPTAPGWYKLETSTSEVPVTDPETGAPVTNPETGEPQTETVTTKAWVPGNPGDCYWYKDAEGKIVQAKDFQKVKGDPRHSDYGLNAYMIGSDYYYFDKDGNTKKTDWQVFYVTFLDADGEDITDSAMTTHDRMRVLKCDEKGKGAVAHASVAVTAPNGKAYWCKSGSGELYDLKQEKFQGNQWAFVKNVSGNILWKYNHTRTDEAGSYGVKFTGVYWGRLDSGYYAPVGNVANANIKAFESKKANLDFKGKVFYYFKEGVLQQVDGTKWYYNLNADGSKKGEYPIKFSKSKTTNGTKGVSYGTRYDYGKQIIKRDGKYKLYAIASTTVGGKKISDGRATLYTTECVYNLYHFKKGIRQSPKGWKKIAKKWYYFNKDSKAVTGNKKKAPGISNSKKSYYYYFRKDGSLITNLFAYNKAFMKSKMKIIADDNGHNCVFLLYNSSTKKYDIAALQVIMSSPKHPNGSAGIARGNYLLSASSRGWLQNKKKTMWFTDCTFINTLNKKRTGFFFHSPAYTKRSYTALSAGAYNNFGSNNTGGCLRLQGGYCKLVGQIGRSMTKYGNVKVVYVKSGSGKQEGPFVKVTKAMIKLTAAQAKAKRDPTLMAVSKLPQY